MPRTCPGRVECFQQKKPQGQGWRCSRCQPLLVGRVSNGQTKFVGHARGKLARTRSPQFLRLSARGQGNMTVQSVNYPLFRAQLGEPCTCLVPMRRSEWHRVCVYALCFSLSTFSLFKIGRGEFGATQSPFPAYWTCLVTLRPERDDGDGDGDGHKRARSQRWLPYIRPFYSTLTSVPAEKAWADSSLSAIACANGMEMD